MPVVVTHYPLLIDIARQRNFCRSGLDRGRVRVIAIDDPTKELIPVEASRWAPRPGKTLEIKIWGDWVPASDFYLASDWPAQCCGRPFCLKTWQKGQK